MIFFSLPAPRLLHLGDHHTDVAGDHNVHFPAADHNRLLTQALHVVHAWIAPQESGDRLCALVFKGGIGVRAVAPQGGGGMG